VSQKKFVGFLRWVLPARRERPRCRAAKERDELASFQLIEGHSVTRQPGSQDIELAMVSQGVRRLFHNPAVVR